MSDKDYVKTTVLLIVIVLTAVLAPVIRDAAVLALIVCSSAFLIVIIRDIIKLLRANSRKKASRRQRIAKQARITQPAPEVIRLQGPEPGHFTQQPPRPRWLGLAAIAAATLITMAAIAGYNVSNQNASAKQLSPAEIAAKRQARLHAICASSETNDRLKEIVFSEAIKIRNADPVNLETLQTYALARMEGPAVKSHDDDLGITICTGQFVLDVPPGAERGFGGLRRLPAEVEYSAQKASDNTGPVYQIDGAEPIIYKLAAFDLQSGRYQTRNNSNPSFDCRYSSTPAEKMVCANSELAASDRELSSVYYSAMVASNGPAKSHIRDIRNAFTARREECATEECIAEAYRDAVTEIKTISGTEG